MIDVSVIIPSRNEKYLSNTIDDIMVKAKSNIEVIAILDGYWPTPQLKDYPNLVLIHNTDPKGMRPGINSGVAASRGKYIMKCDAHCIFDEGFDIKLMEDCEENDVVIPAKYSVCPEPWSVDWKKPPWHYFYLTFPYEISMYGPGLHAKNYDRHYNKQFQDKKIDEIISFQGSCWFMHKKFFDETIGPLDHENYYFYQEAQEIGFKAWLSGGRVLINKKTWYAHLHKGKEQGRGYYLDLRRKRDSEKYCIEYWSNNSWDKQVRTYEWLIDKFSPLPGWPADWKDPKYKDQFGQKSNIVIETPKLNIEDIILKKYNLDPLAKMPLTLDCTREDFPALFHELGLKVGVEIGVERGLYSESLLKKNPGSKLYCVDAWKAYHGYRDHVNQEKLDGFYEQAKARLAPYDATLIRKFSLDAVKDFKDGSLDYVYIDGNHDFQNTTNDIYAWSKKVKIGGVIAGHDFERHKGKSLIHVKEVVCALTYALRLTPWFITACVPRHNPDNGNVARSFLWVKKCEI